MLSRLKFWGPRRKKTWYFFPRNSPVHLPHHFHLLELTALQDGSRKCEQQIPFALIVQMLLNVKQLGAFPFCPIHVPCSRASPRPLSHEMAPPARCSTASGQKGQAGQANSISGSSVTHFQKSPLGELVKRPSASPGGRLNWPL